VRVVRTLAPSYCALSDKTLSVIKRCDARSHDETTVFLLEKNPTIDCGYRGILRKSLTTEKFS
jgi:hypothetical protein